MLKHCLLQLMSVLGYLMRKHFNIQISLQRRFLSAIFDGTPYDTLLQLLAMRDTQLSQEVSLLTVQNTFQIL